MSPEDDVAARREALAQHLGDVIQDELARDFFFREQLAAAVPDRVRRLLDNLVLAAANNAAVEPHRQEEAELGAREFANEIVSRRWGDWSALEEEIIEAARRCRYWPFCWSGHG